MGLQVDVVSTVGVPVVKAMATHPRRRKGVPVPCAGNGSPAVVLLRLIQMPLTDVGGLIICILQHLAHSDLLVFQPHGQTVFAVGKNPHREWVPASYQAGTVSCAHRESTERMVTVGCIGAERVHIGRVHWVSLSVAYRIGPPLVRKNEQQVFLFIHRFTSTVLSTSRANRASSKLIPNPFFH